MIYKFKDTGNLYEVLQDNEGIIMKNPETRKWQRAIIYKSLMEENGLIFIRERNEFLEKFEIYEKVR